MKHRRITLPLPLPACIPSIDVQGCGQCGGDGCGTVPLTQVFSDGRDLPLDATASDYCCTKGFTNSTMSCDEPGAEPPCFIPKGAVCTEVVGVRLSAVVVGRTASCPGETEGGLVGRIES